MNPLLGSVVERERLTVSSAFETDSESHAVGAVLFLLLLAIENQKRPLGQTWIGDDAKTHPRSPARECDMSDRGYTTLVASRSADNSSTSRSLDSEYEYGFDLLYIIRSIPAHGASVVLMAM